MIKANHTIVIDFDCGQHILPGEGWAELCLRPTIINNINNTLISDWLQPRITMTYRWTLGHR